MRVLLTLCLLQQTSAQTLLQVCGTHYAEAIANCATNPTCPAGDGCPADKITCYAIPENECYLPESEVPTPSPVSNASLAPASTAPTLLSASNATTGPSANGAAMSFASPTAPPQPAATHTFVCGVDYSDAVSNCAFNQACPSGDGCGDLTCYAIPMDACQTASAPSSSPPTSSASNVTSGGNTPSPSATTLFANDTAGAEFTSTPPPNENATASPSEAPLETAPPTPAPTDNNRFCGANYTDADANCSPERACPGGFECKSDETCFAGILCPVPAPFPTEAPTLNNRFCGVNYTHAETGCSFEQACPLGTECPDGLACFAGIFCPATTAAPSPEPTPSPTEAVSIVPTPQPSLITQYCGMNHSDAEANCSPESACPQGWECVGGTTCFAGITYCPVKNVTYPPSPAPTMNTYYCGANYTDAMESCSTERACPSGSGCTGGMTCFSGVTCAGEVETGSPTLAPSGKTTSTAPTRFCGANFSDAQMGCSFESTCPLGNECARGFACFTNIMCPALQASASPTPAPSNATATTSSTSTTESLSGVNLWYCGSSPQDAADNCSVNQPCPNGTAVSCAAGQTCFPIPEACNITTAAPSTSATNPPTSHKSAVTSFCGKNWTDAMENCHTATPCPGGSSEECPDHQGCFQGILQCVPPNRTDAAFFNPLGQEPTESSSSSLSQDKENSFAYGTMPGYIKSSSSVSWGSANAALPFLVAVVAGMVGTVL